MHYNQDLDGRLVADLVTSRAARIAGMALCSALLGLVAACRAVPDNASVLLYNGPGASRGDVSALERILSTARLEYSTIGAVKLNGMTEAQIRRYRLFIVPGGNFEQIGNGLTVEATRTLRNAIQHGASYLGICAGAFFAGNSPYNGLNLTSGTRFGFFSAEARGIHKSVVAIATADGATLDAYWEDGPQLTGWGAVVARYPDGMPAVVEGSFGGGWVLLTGVHPEAPASWRRGMPFRTPIETDHAYAATLIRAALAREPLPHY